MASLARTCQEVASWFAPQGQQGWREAQSSEGQGRQDSQCANRQGPWQWPGPVNSLPVNLTMWEVQLGIPSSQVRSGLARSSVPTAQLRSHLRSGAAPKLKQRAPGPRSQYRQFLAVCTSGEIAQNRVSSAPWWWLWTETSQLEMVLKPAYNSVIDVLSSFLSSYDNNLSFIRGTEYWVRRLLPGKCLGTIN